MRVFRESVTRPAGTIAGVRNGTAARGGAVDFTGTDGSALLLIQQGSQLNGNTATGVGGGAVAVTAGTLIVRNSSFADNTATGGNGVGGAVLIAANGTLGLVEAVLIGNEANRAGGEIEIGSGRLDARTSYFGSNAAGTGRAANRPAPGNGGALHATGGALLEVSDSRFETNSAANEGGALWNPVNGQARVRDSVFTGNAAAGNFTTGSAANEGGGGAVFNDGGLLFLNTSLLEGNRASGATGTGGGVFVNGGTASLTGNTLRANTAPRAGGGLEVFGTAAVFLDGVTFDANTAGTVPAAGAAPGNGGAVHVGSGSAVVVAGGSIFTANRAADEGGGLWVNAGSSLFVNNSVLSANVAFDGGGVFNNGGRLVVQRSYLNDNVATGSFSGSFSNPGSTGGGGGVFSLRGTLSVSDSVLVGNRASNPTGSGGGMFLAATVASLRDNFLTGNTAGRGGGGIATGDLDSGSDVTISGGTFLGNFARGVTGLANSPGYGGGIHINDFFDEITVTDTVFSGNQATGQGGAVWIPFAAELTLERTGFVANAAPEGGAIYNDSSRLAVRNSTFERNTAVNGGAIYMKRWSLTVLAGVFRENVAANFGGAIYTTGTVTLNAASSVTGNRAEDVSGTFNSPDADPLAGPGPGGGVFVAFGGAFSRNGADVSGNSPDQIGGPA